MSNLLKGPTCLVCGKALSPAEARTSRLCRDLACHWRYASLAREQTCGVCRRPLAPQERAAGVCGDESCRRTWFVARHREYERGRQRALEARAESLRASTASGAGVDDAERYAVTLTPAFEGTIAKLPARRRHAFRTKLRDVIARAIVAPDAPTETPSAPVDEPPADVGALLGAACAGCRGYCCKDGAEHAYLNPPRLRRYLAEHPEQSADDALAAYESHLPAASYRGSCVFHGARGCTLPRDMRSDTCNRFFCGALAQLRRAHDSGDTRPRFLAAAHDWRVLRASFADQDGPRFVDADG